MAQVKLNMTYGASGTLPAVSGANLTNLTSGNLTGALPALNASALTNLDATDLSGNLPALNASALTTINASNISSGTLNTSRYVDVKGKINQITRTFTTTGNSSVGTTSTSYEDSGITVSITPSATDSVIIVDFTCAMSVYKGTIVAQTSLYRAIGAGADTEVTTASYKWSYINYPLTTSDTIYAPMFLRFIDTTHNTTSACAYKIYFLTTNASYQYTLAHSNTTYSMIATEVLA